MVDRAGAEGSAQWLAAQELKVKEITAVLAHQIQEQHQRQVAAVELQQ